MDGYDYAPVGIYDDEEDLLRNGGYAPVAPPPSDAGPPPSAPPVTSSAPMPAVGSLGDLEARAGQPSTYHGPDSTPPAPRPSWKDYAPPEPHGWGKVGHSLAAINPITNRIFNQMPEQRAEQNYKNATAEYEAPIAEQDKEAQAEQNQARAELERQQAETLRKNGGQKQGLTPEETTIHDLMTGESGTPRVNPQTGNPYSYLEAYAAVNQAKQDPQVKDKQQDIGDYLAANKLTDTPANRETARKAIAERGKQEPGSYMPLYDDKGHVTGAWDPKSGHIVKPPAEGLPGTTGAGVTQQTKAADANKKALDPLQGVIDEIAESREFAASPSATNDYGLLMNFIGVTKPESLAKLRLNQNEVSLAKGTRSALGDLEALGKKLESGETLTADQRASMLKTMDVVEKFTRRRMDALTSSGGENKGGGEPQRPTTVPANYVYKENGPKGTGWYKP